MFALDLDGEDQSLIIIRDIRRDDGKPATAGFLHVKDFAHLGRLEPQPHAVPVGGPLHGYPENLVFYERERVALVKGKGSLGVPDYAEAFEIGFRLLHVSSQTNQTRI